MIWRTEVSSGKESNSDGLGFLNYRAIAFYVNELSQYFFTSQCNDINTL